MRRLNLLISVLLLTITGQALAKDKDQPVELMADSVDIDQAKGESVYKGDVDLKQGSMHLQASQVTVRQQGRKPSRAIAVGSVRFQQDSGRGLIKARAKRAEYEINSELLVLTGNASLTRASNTIKSERIVYDRVHHKVKAGARSRDGKRRKRVRITIQPGK